MKFRTIAYLILLGAIWGCSFLFQRITVPVIGAGMTGAGRMTLENLSFSNLLFQDVTGPIGINFSGRNRNEDGGAEAQPRH